MVLGDTNFGYWNSYYNEETGLYDSYFYFDTYYIQRLYNITITYDNGATYENTLEDAVSSKKVTYTDNQSSTNPWQAGGENNLITVQSGDISKNINVPVKSFHELYSGCPELKEDTTLPVTYGPSHQLPRDCPGILVAAGPSLNKNIQELKKAKGKAFIVAVDTAIKPLLQEGILPDMFAIVDAEKPLDLVKIEGIRDVPLMTTLNAAPEVLAYHRGMKFF